MTGDGTMPREHREHGSPEAAACDALDQWYAAWNAHDAAAILALTTDDVRYEDAVCPEPALSGHVKVRGYRDVAHRAVPDLRIEMRDTWSARADA